MFSVFFLLFLLHVMASTIKARAYPVGMLKESPRYPCILSVTTQSAEGRSKADGPFSSVSLLTKQVLSVPLGWESPTQFLTNSAFQVLAYLNRENCMAHINALTGQLEVYDYRLETEAPKRNLLKLTFRPDALKSNTEILIEIGETFSRANLSYTVTL